jgi:hypothetical protein
MSIDDTALRRDVLAHLRSPASENVYAAIEVSWWVCALGAALMACAGLCMLPTVIWTIAGLRALWSVFKLEQFNVPNPRLHPEKLVPLIAYGIIIGPDKRHGLVLATFSSQSQYACNWMAEKASQFAELYAQSKARTNDSRDEALCALLRDDIYDPARRRRVPEPNAQGADLWLLDVEVDPQQMQIWPDKAALFAFIAEPGERGDVVQIPWSVVANAVRISVA